MQIKIKFTHTHTHTHTLMHTHGLTPYYAHRDLTLHCAAPALAALEAALFRVSQQPCPHTLIRTTMHKR